MPIKHKESKRNTLLSTVSIVTAAAAAALTAAPAPAMAQDTTADEGEAIVVTGSRVARRDFVANSPVATVGQEELELSQVVTVESLLNEMPQVVPGLSGTSNNPGLNGQATVDLRGLTPARTLVLINGRRLAPSDKNGTVDLNLIPASLIQNIEVVTGGASAVYGSDAVAGVVNFVLNDDFEGVEAGAMMGVAEQGDAQQYSYDLTAGGSFADGRGHATVTFNYFNRDSLLGTERPESQQCHPFFCSSRIPSGALINSVLNPYPDGSVDGTGGVTSDLRINDAGTDLGAQPNYNFSPTNFIVLPAERFNFGLFSSYEFNDSVEGYFEGLIADSLTSVQLAPTPVASTNGLTISSALAQAYLGPNADAQILGRPDPNAPILLQRRMLEWGPRVQEFDKNFFQTTLGFRGSLPGEWQWDTYYSFSQTDMYDTLSNDQSKTRLQAALDACPVGSPAGCVTWNPFGENTAPADVVAWTSLQNVTDHHRYTQEVFSATITGDAFELPAGPVGLAVGFEWREDDLNFEPSPSSTGDITGFNATQAIGGVTSVTEFFGEAIVPLIANAPFAEYVGLELGARFADYSSAGEVETYKAGGEWQLFDSLRLRGMWNVATRAPSVFQLFRAGDQNFPGYTDPCRNDTGAGGGQAALNGTAVAVGSPEWNFCAGWLGLSTAVIDQPATDAVLDSFWQSDSQVESFLFGNPNLAVEDSETITYGIVFTEQLPFGDIQAAVDFYDITVQDPIGFPTTNQIIQRCVTTLNLASPQCLAAPRIGSGQLGGVVNILENLPGEIHTEGVDVQVGYSTELFGGDLSVSAMLSFLDEYSISGTDYAGVAYGLGVVFPEFKSSLRTTYRHNDWQFSWQWTHISELDDYFYSSTYAGTPYAANYPFIDAIDYHDFSVRWFATDNVDFTVTCENCLDQEPQADTIHGSAAGLGVDTSLYDILGRYWRFGVRARF